MENDKIIEMFIDEVRHEAHTQLDKAFDYVQKKSFIQGRESAITELLPLTTIYQKQQKINAKNKKKN